MRTKRPIGSTHAYSAYGAGTDASDPSGPSRVAYAGEIREADTGWSFLGERPYSSTLRRFIAPDPVSPFDGGGVNRYAYCSGDPVNRIDPSGHTWLAWIGASQGLAGNTGATRSVSPVARSAHEVAATPTSVASTAVAVLDAVSVTSSIDSVARMTSGRQKADGLFGWIGMGAATSSESGLPAPRNGAPIERFLGADRAISRSGSYVTKSRRKITFVTDADIPAERLGINRFGKQEVPPQWMYGEHDQNPYSMIWAPDTVIRGPDFTKVFALLSGRGATHVNVYTGAHGEPFGRNWHLRTGQRLDAEPKFFLEDLVHSKAAAKSVGATITPMNMALMTKQEMQHLLQRDGFHLIGSCFGIADEVVMEALQLQQATVYHFF